jgi:Uncharacterised protein family (UPF0182)
VAVATEVGMSEGVAQTTQAMQPNFVLMKLPGEIGEEFVEILPFTPAIRNNLIGALGWNTMEGKGDYPKPAANLFAGSSSRAAGRSADGTVVDGELVAIDKSGCCNLYPADARWQRTEGGKYETGFHRDPFHMWFPSQFLGRAAEART